MNEIVWFISRSLPGYLWIIPIVYVFWPKFACFKNDNKNKNKINTRIEVTDNSTFFENMTDDTSDMSDSFLYEKD